MRFLQKLSHWFFNMASWRVKYSDGAESARFIYSDAKHYAKIFNGEVFFDPE